MVNILLFFFAEILFAIGFGPCGHCCWSSASWLRHPGTQSSGYCHPGAGVHWYRRTCTGGCRTCSSSCGRCSPSRLRRPCSHRSASCSSSGSPRGCGPILRPAARPAADCPEGSVRGAGGSAGGVAATAAGGTHLQQQGWIPVPPSSLCKTFLSPAPLLRGRS